MSKSFPSLSVRERFIYLHVRVCVCVWGGFQWKRIWHKAKFKKRVYAYIEQGTKIAWLFPFGDASSGRD